MATKIDGSAAAASSSARERLLTAANELFYEEGVHSVGIDRVIERAGVAKASLYNTFGSKEELVRAYLEARAERRKNRILDRIARFPKPREKILGIFDLLAEIVVEPTFRGCAFVNASAEEPRGETKVRRVCSDSRAWVRATFADLARDLELANPEGIGRQLTLLYDGAVVGSSMDGGPTAANQARSLAELVLDSSPKKKKKNRS